jgi:hypothetical protein
MGFLAILSLVCALSELLVFFAFARHDDYSDSNVAELARVRVRLNSGEFSYEHCV